MLSNKIEAGVLLTLAEAYLINYPGNYNDYIVNKIVEIKENTDGRRFVAIEAVLLQKRYEKFKQGCRNNSLVLDNENLSNNPWRDIRRPAFYDFKYGLYC